MKDALVLGIDTSGSFGAVALCENSKVLAEHTFEAKESLSKKRLPSLS